MEAKTNDNQRWDNSFKQTALDLGISNILSIADVDQILIRYRFLAYLAVAQRRKLKKQIIPPGINIESKILQILLFQQRFLNMKDIECILFASEPENILNKYCHNMILASVLNLEHERKISSHYHKGTAYYGLRDWGSYGTYTGTWNPNLFFLRDLSTFEEY